MADDGFSPEMLDAYFTVLGRQDGEGQAGGAADVGAALAALTARGINPDLTPDEIGRASLLEQGRSRARPRYQKAIERAQQYGYDELRQRIEGLVEADAERHARREQRRMAVGATAGDRPVPPAAAPRSMAPLPPMVGGPPNPMLGPIDYTAPLPGPVPRETAGSTQPPLADAVTRWGLEQGGPMGEAAVRTGRGINYLGRVAGDVSGYFGGRRALEAAGQGDYGTAVTEAATAAAPYVAGPVMGGTSRLLGAAGVPAGGLRAFGSGLGGGLVLETAGGRGPLMSQAEAQPRGRGSEAIMRLQEQLRDAGYYNGPIDGVLSPDSPTMKAKERFEADQKAKADAANRAAETAARTNEAAAKAKEAEAQAAETERRRQEGERQARELAEGSRRLRDMEESVPLWQTALRQYGPIVGYGLGGVAGHYGQRAVSGAMESASTRAAGRANALMAARTGDVPARVGRVNQFWAEGSPGRAEPFSFAASGRPHPYQVNPAAPAAGELYQPSAMDQAARWGTIPAIGAGESGIVHFLFSAPYRREREEAEAAVSGTGPGRGPTEANIQRLQAAKDREAIAEFMENIGRGAAVSGLVSERMHPTVFARPNTNVAEMERGRIANLLTPSRPRGGGPSGGAAPENMLARLSGQRPTQSGPTESVPPPAPRGVRQAEGPPEGAEWNPRTNRWHLRGQMIGGPDRWAPPPRRNWRDYSDE